MQSIVELIQPTTGEWSPERPASCEAIELAELQNKVVFPDTYQEFLKYSNGGSGDLPVPPFLLIFWKCEELLSRNQLYEIENNVPGFFGIGSNGAGEMFAFKTNEIPWAVYIIPFIPMDESEAIRVADDFQGLLRMIGKSPQTDGAKQS
jgi:hypothetical protein